MVVAAIFAAYSCGPSEKEIREKEIQDSIHKADSLAAIVVEAESWEIYQAGVNKPDEFKSKFENKKVLVRNLVVAYIWSGKDVIQCYAYNPTDKMLSNPSREGDPAKKLSKMLDVLQGVECAYNPDLGSFAWYFELHFEKPVEDPNVKSREVIEEPNGTITNYFSIITVKGDSLHMESNSFVLKNCEITNVNVK